MKPTTEEFDTLEFEKRLTNLKGTQESIQGTSSWCLSHRAHHKKIVASWLNVLKQVRVEQRLNLFHLANDVIQYSKRKNYEFVESWGTTLQRATTMVRDDRVKSKIQRIFHIWDQRSVYNKDFLTDLNGLLSINPVKKSRLAEDVDDFQASMLIDSIKSCMRIESETDNAFKRLSTNVPIDSETLAQHKDRQQVEEFEKDIQDQKARLEAYVKAVEAEIKIRTTLLSVVTQSQEFYHNQRSDVKVVVNAYKSFGNSIKGVKKCLEEKLPTLSSPMPSPDINAPSPEPFDDFNLPDSDSINSSMISSKSTAGLLGFLNSSDSGQLPFDISDFTRSEDMRTPPIAQPIQVINSHKSGGSDLKSPTFNSGDFFKSVLSTPPAKTPLPVPPVKSFGGTSVYSSATKQLTPELDDMYSPQRDIYSPFPSNTAYSDQNPFNQTTRAVNAPAYSSPATLPPPPLPPNTNDYDPLSWNSMDDWNNEEVETPVSPPHFEQEPCANQNVIEYREQDEDDIDNGALSRDMDPSIENKRLVHQEIHHRNLISLTGSPTINKTETTLNSSGGGNWSDVDFRQPPPGFQQSGDNKNDSSDGRCAPSNMVQTAGMIGISGRPALLPPPPLPPFNLAGLNFVPPPGMGQYLPGSNMLPRAPPGMMQMNNMMMSQHHGGPLMGGTNIQRGRRKSENGRLPSDNVESVDMEMSDEDYEQDSHGRHHHNNIDDCQQQNDIDAGDELIDELDDNDLSTDNSRNMYNTPPPPQHMQHHHNQQQLPGMGRRPPLMPTPPDTMLMPSPNGPNNRNNRNSFGGGRPSFANQWDGNGCGNASGEGLIDNMGNDVNNMSSPSGPSPLRNPFSGVPRPMAPFQHHLPKNNGNNFRGGGVGAMRGVGGVVGPGIRSPYFRPRGGSANFRGGCIRGRGGGFGSF